ELEEELVEMPRSQTIGYYLKHEINEKLIKGRIGNQRYDDTLLATRLGKIDHETYNSLPVGPMYNAILNKKITKKEDIGGNFVIPCNVGGLKYMNALVDQGSDVNIMPLSIYNRLTNEKPIGTNIKLSLASHLYIFPLEDDRIIELIVQDLVRSLSLEANASEPGYPKSVKEAKDRLIEQLIGKKQTRLQLYTKDEEEKGTQTLETASKLLVTLSEHLRDGIRKFETAPGLNRHSEALEDLEELEEELVEMPRSQTIGYYLKHEINEKLIKGRIGNQRYNDTLLATRLGKIDHETYNSLPVGPMYNAILNKKITKKEDIGGNFVIPCNVGGLKYMNALVDQGSDVNIMPLSIYNRLTNEKPIGTNIRLSLASHLYIFPLGIAEDVLVEIAGYIYLIDFVILDVNKDIKKPNVSS
nr:hypothetical protein [Tanacetum cinerariifolium]